MYARTLLLLPLFVVVLIRKSRIWSIWIWCYRRMRMNAHNPLAICSDLNEIPSKLIKILYMQCGEKMVLWQNDTQSKEIGKNKSFEHVTYAIIYLYVQFILCEYKSFAAVWFFLSFFFLFGLKRNAKCEMRSYSMHKDWCIVLARAQIHTLQIRKQNSMKP